MSMMQACQRTKDGMKTDRELLELAAKAVGGLAKPGQEVEWQPENGGAWVSGNGEGWRWSPLTDDGDAQRLAVKCKITVVHDGGKVTAERWEGDDNTERYGESGDPYSATRRAIVRAAAAIGESMP